MKLAWSGWCCRRTGVDRASPGAGGGGGGGACTVQLGGGRRGIYITGGADGADREGVGADRQGGIAGRRATARPGRRVELALKAGAALIGGEGEAGRWSGWCCAGGPESIEVSGGRRRRRWWRWGAAGIAGVGSRAHLHAIAVTVSVGVGPAGVCPGAAALDAILERHPRRCPPCAGLVPVRFTSAPSLRRSWSVSRRRGFVRVRSTSIRSIEAVPVVVLAGGLGLAGRHERRDDSAPAGAHRSRPSRGRHREGEHCQQRRGACEPGFSLQRAHAAVSGSAITAVTPDLGLGRRFEMEVSQRWAVFPTYARPSKGRPGPAAALGALLPPGSFAAPRAALERCAGDRAGQARRASGADLRRRPGSGSRRDRGGARGPRSRSARRRRSSCSASRSTAAPELARRDPRPRPRGRTCTGSGISATTRSPRPSRSPTSRRDSRAHAEALRGRRRASTGRPMASSRRPAPRHARRLGLEVAYWSTWGLDWEPICRRPDRQTGRARSRRRRRSCCSTTRLQVRGPPERCRDREGDRADRRRAAGQGARSRDPLRGAAGSPPQSVGLAA